MYKGDVLPAEAFAAIRSNDSAVFIDCRTRAEWMYVGTPDYPELVKIVWQPARGEKVDPKFIAEVEALNIDRKSDIYIICRSGFRSANAAHALTAAGFENCYNVAEGFEGDKDENGHRGTIGGWKVAGLPWVQS